MNFECSGCCSFKQSRHERRRSEVTDTDWSLGTAQNFVLSCLLMQFASSLDPNDDGSYNPLRTYADLLNFVFNGLFVLELGIRC